MKTNERIKMRVASMICCPLFCFPPFFLCNEHHAVFVVSFIPRIQ